MDDAIDEVPAGRPVIIVFLHSAAVLYLLLLFSHGRPTIFPPAPDRPKPTEDRCVFIPTVASYGTVPTYGCDPQNRSEIQLQMNDAFETQM